MKSFAIVLFVPMMLLFAASCEKEKNPDQAAATASATVAPTPAPAASITNENIPVAADFEEEAEKAITSANYKSELDSLEAEIK